MNSKQKVEAGRVAFRVEGDRWVAYYAMPLTMEGAIFLGSIHFGAVRNSPDRKEAFMMLMQGIVQECFADKGIAAEWPAPQPAPEHERSGRA